MRTDIPSSIVDTSHDLSVEAIVTLFHIELTDNTIFLLSPTKAVTWLGDTYEEVPCKMTGAGKRSDDEVVRPKFSFANPGGIFTSSLYSGAMNNALITRIRILSSDLENDLDFAIREQYRVSRIMNISSASQMATVELRHGLDGHNFFLPARTYTPPEFPHVRLR